MTVIRAFLEWLESDFFVQTEKDCRVSQHGRGRNGCFQPMRTRQVGGMAFVIPLAEGECGEGLSGGLALIALD